MMKSLFKKNRKQELETVMSCLLVICASCLMIWLTQTMQLCYELGKDDTDDFIWQVLSRSITLVAMAVCSIFIWIMLSNVKRNEVFTKRNANLIVFIGVTVEMAGLLQYILGIFTLEGISRESFMIYLLLGVFILFIGCLFKIGIRMKEEQDLTI
ncbi:MULTISPECIES: DUF2975 domain-containing protein [Bacteroides]|uniref:DUF2975 domain-containing protein n=1 Tax=Bacteroides TaxID=816 RepID=UPI001F2FEF1D|nr:MULTISPECIES: DUF2975 domain-containing protein [Bacteroides]